MALPALRLQGLYLALASMACAVMAIPLFFAQPEILGSSGRKLATPRFFGIGFENAKNFLVLAAVVFALLGLFVVGLRRGRFGRRLVALRDSPAASATDGVNLMWTELLLIVQDEVSFRRVRRPSVAAETYDGLPATTGVVDG